MKVLTAHPVSVDQVTLTLSDFEDRRPIKRRPALPDDRPDALEIFGDSEAAFRALKPWAFAMELVLHGCSSPFIRRLAARHVGLRHLTLVACALDAEEDWPVGLGGITLDGCPGTASVRGLSARSLTIRGPLVETLSPALTRKLWMLFVDGGGSSLARSLPADLVFNERLYGLFLNSAMINPTALASLLRLPAAYLTLVDCDLLDPDDEKVILPTSEVRRVELGLRIADDKTLAAFLRAMPRLESLTIRTREYRRETLRVLNGATGIKDLTIGGPLDDRFEIARDAEPVTRELTIPFVPDPEDATLNADLRHFFPNATFGHGEYVGGA